MSAPRLTGRQSGPSKCNTRSHICPVRFGRTNAPDRVVLQRVRSNCQARPHSGSCGPDTFSVFDRADIGADDHSRAGRRFVTGRPCPAVAARRSDTLSGAATKDQRIGADSPTVCLKWNCPAAKPRWEPRPCEAPGQGIPQIGYAALLQTGAKTLLSGDELRPADPASVN
jgi:hypothetical protein